VTTVCNHAFHAACLRNWVDASCPVCRYSQAPPDSSRCEVCGTRDNLWICLVCGAVGCGRYANGHAVSHWRESGHCYSLELATQRVWDYLGDGYVHRLIASKTHGHLVELTPPASRTRRRGGSAAGGGADCGDGDADGAGGGGDGDDQLDDDPVLDEVLLASKLDAVGLEYNQLLSSQLESQREYFQTLIASARADADAARQSAEAADARAAIATGRATAAEAQAKDADRALKLAERKSEDTAQKLAACAKELDTLRQWNADLIAGKREAEAKADAVAAQARAAATAHDARERDLEEQVSDLATFLDAQKAIEGAGDKNTVVTIRAPAAEAAQTPRHALRAKLQAAKGERGRK
jgi:BRCA1-associated protein